MPGNNRKGNNRSILISDSEIKKFSKTLVTLKSPAKLNQIINSIINQDLFDALKLLPTDFVDLLFVDPPYNMSKSFNSKKFSKMSVDSYSNWLENLIQKLLPLLKKNASIYVCGDWFTSTSIHTVLSKYMVIRNRITWEREKGRGARSNWKNSSEDIWFATLSDEYYFDVNSVKLKKRVLAPYKESGSPKDWQADEDGNFRLTHPSNLWTDLTVPFWSMPENTEHPTQKPEKLLAKIILASSEEGNVIFDPFLGSGTSAVVAKKLNRQFLGIEIDQKYCALSNKRLELAETNKSIQGYDDGIFWERNSNSRKSKN